MTGCRVSDRVERMRKEKVDAKFDSLLRHLRRGTGENNEKPIYVTLSSCRGLNAAHVELGSRIRLVLLILLLLLPLLLPPPPPPPAEGTVVPLHAVKACRCSVGTAALILYRSTIESPSFTLLRLYSQIKETPATLDRRLGGRFGENYERCRELNPGFPPKAQSLYRPGCSMPKHALYTNCSRRRAVCIPPCVTTYSAGGGAAVICLHLHLHCHWCVFIVLHIPQ